MTITYHSFNYTIHIFGVFIMVYTKQSKFENLFVLSDHKCSKVCHKSISCHKIMNNISKQTSVISPGYEAIYAALELDKD